MPVYRTVEKPCVTCGDVFTQQAYGAGVSRCPSCGAAWEHFKKYGSGRYEANLKMVSAIRRGTLKPATEFACVDCARAAQCYDHRDYSKPLEVAPVCFSCNVLRGPAKPVAEFVAPHATLEVA